MYFCGNVSSEKLLFHIGEECRDWHWIEMEMAKDVATFKVTFCCDDEWMWEFYYDKTTYEQVKYVIMSAIDVCEDMDELITTLDEVFEEMFLEDTVLDEAELLEDEVEFICDGDCKNCEFNV